MRTHGVFHRNEATYQTKETAAIQVETQEIWGRTPANGYKPTVQAYCALAAKQARRIEFSTDVKPGAISPFEAWWYLEEDGVEHRHHNGEDFACISVEISKNTQI
jgi:hypothetical protein